MQAGTVESQTAFATEGIVHGPEDKGAGGEQCHHELGEEQSEDVRVPGGVAEEAMESRPVADADVAAGEDDLGDEAMPLGEDPAGDDHREGLVGGCGEDRGEVR